MACWLQIYEKLRLFIKGKAILHVMGGAGDCLGMAGHSGGTIQTQADLHHLAMQEITAFLQQQLRKKVIYLHSHFQS